MGKGFSYAVKGTLNHLPTDHYIWVLTEDEQTGQIRPQGFFLPIFDHATKTWSGRVTGAGGPRKKIWAVVAPPTSHDFFLYFQQVGSKAHSTVKCNTWIFDVEEDLVRGFVSEDLSGAGVEFILDPLDIGM